MIVDGSCRLLIVPLFRGRSRFESLVVSHHSRFNVTCECNKEEINDDDDGTAVPVELVVHQLVKNAARQVRAKREHLTRF